MHPISKTVFKPNSNTCSKSGPTAINITVKEINLCILQDKQNYKILSIVRIFATLSTGI
jgi:hypothetical protein